MIKLLLALALLLTSCSSLRESKTNNNDIHPTEGNSIRPTEFNK